MACQFRLKLILHRCLSLKIRQQKETRKTCNYHFLQRSPVDPIYICARYSFPNVSINLPDRKFFIRHLGMNTKLHSNSPKIFRKIAACNSSLYLVCNSCVHFCNHRQNHVPLMHPNSMGTYFIVCKPLFSIRYSPCLVLLSFL